MVLDPFGANYYIIVCVMCDASGRLDQEGSRV